MTVALYLGKECDAHRAPLQRDGTHV